MHPLTCTVEEVLETAHTTSKEYTKTSKRLAVEAHALLPVNASLTILCDRLESVVGDEEVIERLESIDIENRGQACKFLAGLNSDLQNISAYLQSAGLGPSRDIVEEEVDMYAETLGQYIRVLKVVEKRNIRDVVKRIDTEVALLNEVLARVHSALASNKQLKQGDLYHYLDRLRPLRSAFHNSWGTPEPCQDGMHQETITIIFEWLNESSKDNDHPMVFWLFGNDRSETSAVAQSVALRAHAENRLASSFFFPWSSSQKGRDPADLVPTVMYKLAQYDPDILRTVVNSIIANPDVRDEKARMQIYLLSKIPFINMDSLTSLNLSLLIVIDALDTCNDLDDPLTVAAIGEFIQTLCTQPLRIKVLVTSRFPRAIRQIVCGQAFPPYRQLALPYIIATDRLSYAPIPCPSDDGKELLSFLKPAMSARWDSRASPSGCLEGTRVDIVSTMLTWCMQPTDHFTVYWLAGHAGTGKSAIAKTLCKELDSGHTINIWMISFFVSRDDADRRDPFRILHSLAYELANRDVVICQRILAVIRSHPDVRERALKEQVKELLRAVIEVSSDVCSIVIIVDALDECFAIHGVEGGSLIHDLAEILGDLPVKLVVTSRMEDSLRRMFASLPSQITQLLHEIEKTSVTSDVRLILSDGFADISTKRTISASPWPSPKDLEILVERTGSLLIFAVTVLRFVANDRFSPERRLSEILNNPAIMSDSPELFRLDMLYLNVLLTAIQFNPAVMQVDKVLCRRLRTLVGTLAVLQQPTSTSALAQFMNAHVDEVEQDVRILSAVLIISTDEDSSDSHVVRIFHPSFRDFLLERCNDPRFSVDAEQRNHDLTLACLITLNLTLKHDICDITNPTLSNTDVVDPSLPARLRDLVPETTRYAGQFWMVHGGKLVVPSSELLEAIHVFTEEHLLHWVELLSLIGHVPFAMQHWSGLNTWYNRTNRAHGGSGPNVNTLLSDTHRMLQTYRTVIATHALQVYYSAHITMPQCHLFDVSERFGPGDAPRLKSKRRSDAGIANMVLEGHTDAVLSVAFSPDSLQIVSGSKDKTLRLWGSKTGQELAILRGHVNGVCSVAFSPDSLQVVSGSDDRTVRVWDAESGRNVAVLEGHRSRVTSVAFSSNSLRIVSGSYDKTVRLWDPKTGQELMTLHGHDSHVASVTFSPDSLQVISVSRDEGLRVWSTQTGQELAKRDGFGHHVDSVSLSFDGLQIALGLGDYSVQLLKNQRDHDLFGRHTRPVISVAFSPDSAWLVSGSEDTTVRLWSITTGQEIAILDGHTGTVNSVACSEDASQIASGSDDKTIRIWSPQFRQMFSELHSHPTSTDLISADSLRTHLGLRNTGNTLNKRNTYVGQEIVKSKAADRVTSIAFSSSKLPIASGSRVDVDAVLWTAHTGEEMVEIEGHSAPVTSIAFSADGLQIVSGSFDDTVRLWDAQTGQELVRIYGHTLPVTSVALSPNGARIVSASWDGTVRLWEAQTGQELCKLKGYAGIVNTVAFSSNGCTVYALYDRHPKSPLEWDISGKSCSCFF